MGCSATIRSLRAPRFTTPEQIIRTHLTATFAKCMPGVGAPPPEAEAGERSTNTRLSGAAVASTHDARLSICQVFITPSLRMPPRRTLTRGHVPRQTRCRRHLTPSGMISDNPDSNPGSRTIGYSTRTKNTPGPRRRARWLSVMSFFENGISPASPTLGSARWCPELRPWLPRPASSTPRGRCPTTCPRVRSIS